MIDAFFRKLLASNPNPLSHLDAQLALATLLVRVARTDGDYADVEIARIDAVLERLYAYPEKQKKRSLPARNQYQKGSRRVRVQHRRVEQSRLFGGWPSIQAWHCALHFCQVSARHTT